MSEPVKLHSGHKRILHLTDRDAGEDGWAPVSAILMPHLVNDMPAELVEIEPVGDEGKGRIRLTAEGKNIIEAMKWL